MQGAPANVSVGALFTSVTLIVTLNGEAETVPSVTPKESV